MTKSALTRWLGSLDAADLGDVLRRRPDAMTVPVPTDLETLAGRLSDRAAVTGIFATLPLPAVQVVEAMARAVPDADRPVPLERVAALLGVAPDDHAFEATLRVLSQRALVWLDDDNLWAVPLLLADAAALRSRPLPFEPLPPSPALAPVDRSAVRAEAVTAAGLLLDRLSALLQQGAVEPVGRLRSGGPSSREQRRLAGALAIDEPTVRFLTELALSAELLCSSAAGPLATPADGPWRDAEPAQRLATVLDAWWTMPAVPLLPIVAIEDGQALIGRLAPQLRPVVVRVLHDLPPDTGVTDPATLGPLVRWTAPLPVRLIDDLDATVASLVLEATLVGAVALGAISPFGRALADGRSPAEIAGRLLPPAGGIPRQRGPMRVRVVDGVTVAGDPADRPIPAQRAAEHLSDIRRRAPQLAPDQAEALAQAIERQTPVRIEYVDSQGRHSARIIDDLELTGSVLGAYCHLRRDDRAFTLSGIRTVRAV